MMLWIANVNPSENKHLIFILHVWNYLASTESKNGFPDFSTNR